MFAHCLLQPFLCHQNTNTPPAAHYSEGEKNLKENQSNLMASHVLDLCRSSLIPGFTFSLCCGIWSQSQFILPHTAVGVMAQGLHPQQLWDSGTLNSWLMQETSPLCWNGLEHLEQGVGKVRNGEGSGVTCLVELEKGR